MVHNEMKTVLIIESFPLFEKALLTCLRQNEHFQFKFSSIDFSRLSQMSKELFSIDLIIMDISKNFKQTLKIIQLIKSKISTKILMLDLLADFGRARKCFFHLADGYIVKDAQEDEFYEAIHCLINGKKYIARKLKAEIWNWFTQSDYQNGEACLPSKREMEVLRLIVQEYSTPEIAEKLFISKCTVESHRINLLNKFQVKNTAGLVREAVLQYKPGVLIS